MKFSKELIGKVKAHIDENQPVLYWNYNDELSVDDIEIILFNEDGMGDFVNELLDYNMGYIDELIDLAIKEYSTEFREEFASELGEDVVDSEEFEDEFYRTFVYDVSVDLNTDELIRSHQDEIFFYNTGLFVEEPYNEDAIEGGVQSIKNMLSIDNNELDKKLYELITNASYGGDLVVYFKSSIMDMLEMKKIEMKSIKFSGDVSIAVIDTSGRSGFDTVIQHEFILPFNFDNVFFEKAIKYNYTYAVCGLVSDWCEDTKFELVDTESDKEITNDLKASLEADRKLSDKWKKTGECTFGDMDMSRHKQKEYINDFPCGHKCLSCGTFWID